MIHSIHHVNILVRDLEAAAAKYARLLGLPVPSPETLAGRGVRIARFPVGEAWLCLVQPVGDGAPARHLEAHGEGLFLLSLGCDDAGAEFARLGPDWAAGPARDGLDGWRVRDVDPARTAGAQLQLVTAPRVSAPRTPGG